MREPHGVTYRRAEEADLPRVFEVYRAALNGYLVPAGHAGAGENDQAPVYRHSCAMTASGCGSPARHAGRGSSPGAPGCCVGTGGSSAASSCCRRRRDVGIGARLFELAGKGAPAGAVRATMTDSIQPVSNTLYARRGLLPREVLVEIGGRPRPGLAPPRLGSLEPEPLTIASIPHLREIDAAASGVDRSVDHEYYLTASGRRGWLFRRAGRPVAYVMVRPDGWVGPAASVRAPDVGTVAAFALAALAAEGAETVRAGGARPLQSAQPGVLGRPGWPTGPRPACSSPPGRSGGWTATSRPATACSDPVLRGTACSAGRWTSGGSPSAAAVDTVR